MPHPIDFDTVRSVAKSLLAEHGAADDDYRETILIRDGLYFGRRYEQGGFSAVWLVAENDLQLFDESGVLVASGNLNAEPLVEARSEIPAARDTTSSADQALPKNRPHAA